MNLHNLLSPSQLKAVITNDVPVCILAGAGTGKTHVLTHRIAYLISKGARPDNVLGLTFTNKAALEMRERVERLIPKDFKKITLGTFHKIGVNLLRRYGESVSVPVSFVIYDNKDSEKLLKEILGQLNISQDYLLFFKNQIEKWQNNGITPDQTEHSLDKKMTYAKQLYFSYVERLQEIGALDFNGILLKTRDLLKFSDKSNLIKSFFQHILIDEYQDTNTIQAEIVYSLALTAKTIAIVGDDDQSIYAWRGAKPHNMEEFLKKIPGTCLIKLEENYRSTNFILSAANSVISNNNRRLGKNLISKKGEGKVVKVIRTTSDRHEAEFVVSDIDLKIKNGYSCSKMVVLMRSNAQTRPFEEVLRFAKIPFRLVGGTRFYDRREIKDILSILRASLNDKSDLDWIRAAYSSRFGIGMVSLDKIKNFAILNGIFISSVILSLDLLRKSGVSLRISNKFQNFAHHIVYLKELVKRVNAFESIQYALDNIGSQEFEDEERLKNVEQLMSAAQQYVDDCDAYKQMPTLFGFLENAALLSSTDENNYSNQDNREEAISLMTIHAAKGLEFDTVYIVGMEEHGFPHSRALEENNRLDKLEEERRLAYVGMTRAQNELILTYAIRRLVRGQIQIRTPSRFLNELSGFDGEIRNFKLEHIK